jgi:molybdate transport system substrate-binding protein
VEINFRIEANNCPPESGGQHDRDEVEIVRGVVPKPPICRTFPLEPPRRFAPPLLTQEGNCRFPLKSAFRTCFTFLVILLTAIPAFAVDLRLAAASDLNFAIKEIISQYEKDTGNHVQLTLGSSGTFFTQISEGAPFDVYLSADRTYPDQLLDRKLAEPGTLFVYGLGRIVIWVPVSSPIDVTKLGMQSLLQPSIRKISIANPNHAPYGRAAVSAMQRAGVYDRVKNNLVLGENISQASEFVGAGAAQVGILALSLALSDPMRGKGKYWEVPIDTYPLMEQAGIILRHARESGSLDAARSFMRALQSPQSRSVLERYGFTAARP